MDIECGKNEYCISVEAYTMHILQIRKKANVVKMFAFHSDGYLRDFDFGWWSDADIIWSNETLGSGVVVGQRSVDKTVSDGERRIVGYADGIPYYEVERCPHCGK